MNQLQRNLIAKTRPQIKFLTSMFYLTLNNKELNFYFWSELLSKFIILDVADIPSRDVIGWHDS